MDQQTVLFSNKSLMAMIIPLFLEQLLIMLVGMADTLVVSYAGEAAVSGVSLVNQFNTIFIYLFTALASGGAVVISQYIGRKKNDDAGESASQLLSFSAIFSILIEIEESAMLDGASMVGGFVRVVVPLVMPGVFTVSIMTFLAVWNNFIFPSVLNQSKSARTVTIALTMFETETYTPWHIISAAAIIASVPLIIVVLLLQKRIVSGMIEGGVKG